MFMSLLLLVFTCIMFSLLVCGLYFVICMELLSFLGVLSVEIRRALGCCQVSQRGLVFSFLSILEVCLIQDKCKLKSVFWVFSDHKGNLNVDNSEDYFVLMCFQGRIYFLFPSLSIIAIIFFGNAFFYFLLYSEGVKILCKVP